MTQLTQTVKQNADSALQANVLVERATDITQVGDASVEAMIDTIAKVSARSRRSPA